MKHEPKSTKGTRKQVDLRVIHARDFIRTTVAGEFHLEESKRLLLELAEANAEAHYNLLVDIRDMESDLSYPDVYELAKVLADHAESFQGKTALLDVYDGRFEMTQFFQAAAEHLGFAVKAFIDFEAAVTWIHDETILRRE
jgi:hypothetical protein